MNRDYLLLFALIIAAIPAFVATMLPAARKRKIGARALVFVGVVLVCLPLALFLALLLIYHVLGIDMLE